MLRPYDFVLTKENFLFMVRNYPEIDGQILASPKYIPYKLVKTKFMGHTWKMLGEEWSRINNPLDPNYEIQKEVLAHLNKYKLNDNNFLIEKPEIEKEFLASKGVEKIMLESEIEQNHTRRKIRKLIDLLKDATPIQSLGLTGSSLFRGEIDGFSDIDLVVYGSDSYKKLSSFLEHSSNPQIHFRTKREWENF